MRMKKNKHSRVTSFIHQKKWQGPSVSYAQFEQGTNPIFECKDLWERRGEKKVVRHSLKNERERERESRTFCGQRDNSATSPHYQTSPSQSATFVLVEELDSVWEFIREWKK